MIRRYLLAAARAIAGYAPPPCHPTPQIAPLIAASGKGARSPSPTPAFAAHFKALPGYDTIDRAGAARLETEAEQLQREVKAATVKNSMVVERGQWQAETVKSFEERSRDTLRDLLDDMGKHT